MISALWFKKIPFFLLAMMISFSLSAQKEDPYVRLAKIDVDPVQLERYLEFLKENMEASLKKEPGVLSMYAVAEKERPHQILIIETYASKAAYELHIQSAHFKKYKQGTLAMVRSLDLRDVVPLGGTSPEKK
jgi:4-carboxymuconolactone decarboxylase